MCQVYDKGYNMNRYIEKLKSFLAEQTPNYVYGDANSILEMLYYYYTMNNHVDNAVIRCQFKELNDVLCRLSVTGIDSVFSLAVDLCVAYERQAFFDGIHVGMRLFSELNELPG